MKKILRILRNRYVFAPVALFIYVLFFDANDLISQISLRWKIHTLHNQIENYQTRIDVANKQIDELTTDMHSLEKFAREQYHMKRDNEEVFVLVKDPGKK